MINLSTINDDSSRISNIFLIITNLVIGASFYEVLLKPCKRKKNIKENATICIIFRTSSSKLTYKGFVFKLCAKCYKLKL